MSESRTIHQRLAAIMREAGPIGKDSVNKSQGFNFRGIDAVMNHLHPIFAKHGVTVLPEVLAERHEDRTSSKGGCLIYRVLTVRFNFVGEGGDSAAATVIGEGMDSGDKAANKAMAVALKYALTQLLLLPYDEVDPDGESHEPSRPRSAAPASIRPPSAKPEAGWIAVCAARKPLADAMKAAGMSRHDADALWENAMKSDGRDGGIPTADKFAVLVFEWIEARKERKA